MKRSINIGSHKPSNTPLTFEADDFDKYIFPHEEVVPEGSYYVMIKKAESSKNRNGDPCFDVCLKLLPIYQPPAWNNGQIDELTYFYVRQRYKNDSEPAKQFKYSMRMIGLPKKFTATDLENRIAIVQLRYNTRSNIGNVADWKPIELPAEWFEDDEILDEEE